MFIGLPCALANMGPVKGFCERILCLSSLSEKLANHPEPELRTFESLVPQCGHSKLTETRVFHDSTDSHPANRFHPLILKLILVFPIDEQDHFACS
jgi:hypothetical protein